MAVSKQKKVEILASLTEQIKNAKSVWFASSVWVTVKEFGDLRKKLREVDASYTLAKKTLIKKAVKDALDIDIDLAVLEWQIAIICSNDDPIAGLSKVNESIFEGKFQDKKETETIASMPSRETLLSRLVGSMKSPISKLARFFDAAAKDIDSNGKTKVWELEWKKEEVAEAPKAEETPAE